MKEEAKYNLVAKNGSYDSNMCLSEGEGRSLFRCSLEKRCAREKRKKGEREEETEGLDFYQCPVSSVPHPLFRGGRIILEHFEREKFLCPVDDAHWNES